MEEHQHPANSPPLKEKKNSTLQVIHCWSKALKQRLEDDYYWNSTAAREVSQSSRGVGSNGMT